MNSCLSSRTLEPIGGKPQPLRGIGDLTSDRFCSEAWSDLRMDHEARQVQQSAREELANMRSVSLGEKHLSRSSKIHSERFLIGRILQVRCPC